MINLNKDDLIQRILDRIKAINNEDEVLVGQLLPVWQAIALGGLLKLVKNRIRYNALMNFLALKVKVDNFDLLAGELKGSDQMIQQFGESLIGILFPDKKSAIAISISQKFQCKSSLVLKGLSYVLGIYVLELKRQENKINNFSDFCQSFISSKAEFYELISPEIQRIISEILVLQDVLKVDNFAIFSDSFEESDDLEESFFASVFTKRNSIILGLFLLIGSLAFYFTLIKNNNIVEVDDEEEIIPIDSLNKLNDSLVQAVVDSSKLQSDSTIRLAWNEGKSFVVPKQSAIIQLHEYLTDSLQTDVLELPVFEVTFSSDNDQIVQSKDYFFKRFAEGLQKYPSSKIEIVAYSEKDIKSAMNRGFFLKNRFVGEGVVPKRISVKANDNEGKPDGSIPLNAQVLIRISKE